MKFDYLTDKIISSNSMILVYAPLKYTVRPKTYMEKKIRKLRTTFGLFILKYIIFGLFILG